MNMTDPRPTDLTTARHVADLAPIDGAALAALRTKAIINAAPVWQPAEGETLEGRIFASRSVTNPFGAQQDQAIVQRVDGSLTALWLSPWMLSQLRVQQADIGDLLSMTYLGQERSARGALYHKYSVAVLKT